MSVVEYVILAGAALIVLSLFWSFIKNIAVKASTLILNSALGLAVLFVLNWFGFSIPIILPTILVCGLFGLPGIASLVILHLFRLI
jgi:pro-sigmaK processing inhibitor BofA